MLPRCPASVAGHYFFKVRFFLHMKTPWGRMWRFISFPGFWAKIIWVRGRTSLQSHANRTEYHFGFYKVNPGEKHRMQHGLFLEIATGKPEESDIIRYEDDYKRV